ncbi:uncharacterized protein LOC133726994 [Rosa rugosa]|uniref:uncharacterized protein LOC133726994 n=1 Tax=Rosa rugosa TaxID=74645 RepID=UPI002B417066|nr:uncharacterized protein LOC133726994 [Rosa rugosa]
MVANAKVNQLMLEPGMWNVDFLKQHFLPVDVDKILSIPLCERTEGDVAVWHFNDDGRYSVKSGYWFGMELRRMERGSTSGSGHANSNSINIWSLMWNLSIPNKVKLFLWRASHAFLPCAELRKVWKVSWLKGVVKTWRVACFTDLFSLVADCGEPRELELFTLICWWIWKDRNEVFHGSSLGLDAQDESIGEGANAQGVKLYFDGASDMDAGRVGLGAVVIDEGRCLKGATAIPMIKALALWHGLKLCKHLGVSRLVIIGDAASVINALGH